MDIYAQIKQQINQDLQSSVIGLLDKHKFPYDFSNNRQEDFYVTFFVANKDYNISKKKLSKHRLTHPNIEIAYTLARSFDYDIVTNPKTNTDFLLTNFTLFYHDVEKPEYFVPMSAKVKIWTRTLIGALSTKYADKYGIKLFRMPIEIYMKSPDDMFISKIPEFEDLTFMATDFKNGKLIHQDFINKQAEMITEAQNLYFKDLTKNDEK